MTQEGKIIGLNPNLTGSDIDRIEQYCQSKNTSVFAILFINVPFQEQYKIILEYFI